MLFQPRIDSGVPLDSAVEAEEFGSHYACRPVRELPCHC
jgi:hypothetical protein